MNLPKRTILLIGFLILITAILVYVAVLGTRQANTPTVVATKSVPPPPSAAARGNTLLTMSPNPLNVSALSLQSNPQLSENVMIDTGTDAVTSVQLEISYDPAVVSDVTITPGTFIPNGAVLINKAVPTTGRITYALVSPLGKEGKKGTGIVATMTFHVKQATVKQTAITLLSETKVAAEGVATSVLKSAAGAIIVLAQ